MGVIFGRNGAKVVVPEKSYMDSTLATFVQDSATSIAEEHIEHTYRFIDFVAPGQDIIRHKTCSQLTPHCGFASSGPTTAPGTLLDVKANNISILTAPVDIGTAPGVPVQLSFVPATVVAANSIITYELTALGASAAQCQVNVQWIKQLDTPPPTTLTPCPSGDFI